MEMFEIFPPLRVRVMEGGGSGTKPSLGDRVTVLRHGMREINEHYKYQCECGFVRSFLQLGKLKTL